MGINLRDGERHRDIVSAPSIIVDPSFKRKGAHLDGATHVLLLSGTLAVSGVDCADWSKAKSPIRPINALESLDSKVAAEVDTEFFAPWILGADVVHSRT